jgi:hypothetical protein
MSITEKVYRAVFETVVMTVPVPVTPDRSLPYQRVNLIVMSRDSAREIMRSQGAADIMRGANKAEPDRIYGVRIAYDDSLGLGQFLAAVTEEETK